MTSNVLDLLNLWFDMYDIAIMLLKIGIYNLMVYSLIA